MKKTIITLIIALVFALLSFLFPQQMSQLSGEEPAATQIAPPISGNGLTVHFIDVGQADCALLECDGEFMIIDGGNVDDGQMVVSYLKQMGVETLAAVVCTHAHEDHVGGLPAVLSVFQAETVYSPVTEYSSKVFNNFLKKTADQGLEVTVPAPGDQFTLGSTAITVLGPVQEYEDPNNTSIVLKVSYGESDFLFTGDMETLAENDMLDYWHGKVDWNTEVLKVGHHGSETSSGYRFIYETMPTYGVISVGTDNSYGHPHEAPMSRLRDAGLVTLRTDLLGHVIARTDGSEITFTWENQSAAPEDAQNAQPIVFYGNKKSGTLHAADCRNLPSESNRTEFSDYYDAIREGYTPCGSCIG